MAAQRGTSGSGGDAVRGGALDDDSSGVDGGAVSLETGRAPGEGLPLDERVRRSQEEVRARVQASLGRPAPVEPRAAPAPSERAAGRPARPEPIASDRLASVAALARARLALARLTDRAPRGLVRRGRLGPVMRRLAPLRRPLAHGLPRRLPRRRAVLLAALGIGLVTPLAAIAALDVPAARRGAAGRLAVKLSSHTVAPGGRITVTGAGAAAGARVSIEARARGGSWRGLARPSADDRGAFRAAARVAARPGRLQLRVRAAPSAPSGPIAVTVRSLRLAAVGDVNLGDLPGSAIELYGPAWPWEGVGGVLRGADLAFANLECTVSRRGAPFPKQFNFRGTRSALAGLRRHAGLDVLNLANNHVGDFGKLATLDTVRAVARLRMAPVGAGRDLRQALAPRVVERLGLRVAFVGFSRIGPIEFAAGRDQPGTAWATESSVTRAVRAARRRADVVVAAFHWGIEKQTTENAEQRSLAAAAARAGAQLVLGSHPHVLQPLRREGAALVAHSLGNFVFGAQSPGTAATGVLELGLTAEGVDSARWRAATISAGRPLLGGAPPRRLDLRPAALGDGVRLLSGP